MLGEYLNCSFFPGQIESENAASEETLNNATLRLTKLEKSVEDLKQKAATNSENVEEIEETIAAVKQNAEEVKEVRHLPVS